MVDDFPVNLLNNGSGFGGLWKFSVPYFRGRDPFHGEILHTGGGWRWRTGENDWSETTHPNRKQAAYAAWISQPIKRRATGLRSV